MCSRFGAGCMGGPVSSVSKQNRCKPIASSSSFSLNRHRTMVSCYVCVSRVLPLSLFFLPSFLNWMRTQPHYVSWAPSVFVHIHPAGTPCIRKFWFVFRARFPSHAEESDTPGAPGWLTDVEESARCMRRLFSALRVETCARAP